MNLTKRYAFSALLAMAALCASVASPAQSSFNGTWKTELSQSKWSTKPFIFYTSQGWYHCVNCTPAFDVQADGQDHPVSGQSYDTINVTIVDPHTLSIVTKKAGKVSSESTRTVSADGKILTVKFNDHPMNSDQPVTFEVDCRRSGKLPAGVHATSGDWVITKETGSANALLTTYKVNGDEVTMTEPTGETYTAKLDGADYPVKGSYSWNGVLLQKVSDHTIIETDKRDGSVIGTYKMTISANGKTMTTVETSEPSGRVATYISTKQ